MSSFLEYSLFANSSCFLVNPFIFNSFVLNLGPKDNNQSFWIFLFRSFLLFCEFLPTHSSFLPHQVFFARNIVSLYKSSLSGGVLGTGGIFSAIAKIELTSLKKSIQSFSPSLDFIACLVK